MKLENKIETFITGFYWLLVTASMYFLVRIFLSRDPLGASIYNTLYFAFLGIPIFAILKIKYKRKYKDQIIKDYKNIFARRLKYVGIVIFTSAIIIFISYANILNKNLSTSNETYNTPVTTIYLMLNDFSRIVWPIVFILFAYNFQKNKDINARYQNLKNLVWATVFFGLLIPFCKTIGLMMYDLELVLLIPLSNVLSSGIK